MRRFLLRLSTKVRLGTDPATGAVRVHKFPKRQNSAGLGVLILTGLLLSGQANAGFNKCVAPDGSVSYQQTPCPAQAEVQTDSVSMLGAGRVSTQTKIRQACQAWADLAIGTSPALELKTCEKKFDLVCASPETEQACRDQLLTLEQKVTVTKAEALSRGRSANATASSSAQKRGASPRAAAALAPVSCREAASVMATASRGPNQMRIQCQQQMDDACSAGPTSDACLLFNNKLSMSVAGRKREQAMKASGEWNKGKSKTVGNVNDVWTACMARANFADDNATFLKRKAECDGLAP